MQSTILLRDRAIKNLKNKYPKNWGEVFYHFIQLHEKDTIDSPNELYRRIYNDTVKLNKPQTK